MEGRRGKASKMLERFKQRAGMIIRKSPSELEKMRASGKLVAQILAEMRRMVEPGVSTKSGGWWPTAAKAFR